MTAITKKALQRALSEDVKDTYNMISVDGDTSTNDNGTASRKRQSKESENTIAERRKYEQFAAALHVVNETLAKKMAGTATGADGAF